MPTTTSELPQLTCRVQALDSSLGVEWLNPGRYEGPVAALAVGDEAWVALGVAWRARWDAAPTLGSVEAVSSQWVERLPEAPTSRHAALPLIWGGLAFFDNAPGGPWAGWPVAELRVPEHLIYMRSSEIEVLSFVESPFPQPQEAAGQRSHQPATATPTPTREAWIAYASRARQELVQGPLNKLVPVRATHSQLPRGARYDRGALWEALGGAPGVRYFWSDGGAAFVGRTPERLVAARGERIETVALAGTAPRAVDGRQDLELGEALLACPKIRREHAAVVEGLELRLRELGLTVETGGRGLRQLAEAQHVETLLRATREGRGLWSLIRDLHPTAALGGAPQDLALRWLEEHAPLPQGWFGAPLGTMDRHGDGEAWVAIRGALVGASDAWSYAGAGVVAASDPAAEWDETELKLTAIKSALEAAQVEGS